jgi:hypothetical protein
MAEYPQITYRKHTFLSALVTGLSALAITLVISCTVVVIYGMNFAGNQSEKLVSLVEGAVRGLPELQESLPPVFADMLNDRRQPDYATQLEITANTTLLPERDGRVRTAVKVVNNGEEVVSLLSLRIVVLNANNEILTESNEWAATPFAAEHDWRGPLMPGYDRYFASSHSGAFPVSSLNDLRTEVEITDIRIWNSQKETLVIDEVSSETETLASPPTELAENP